MADVTFRRSDYLPTLAMLFHEGGGPAIQRLLSSGRNEEAAGYVSGLMDTWINRSAATGKTLGALMNEPKQISYWNPSNIENEALTLDPRIRNIADAYLTHLSNGGKQFNPQVVNYMNTELIKEDNPNGSWNDWYPAGKVVSAYGDYKPNRNSLQTEFIAQPERQPVPDFKFSLADGFSPRAPSGDGQSSVSALSSRLYGAPISYDPSNPVNAWAASFGGADYGGGPGSVRTPLDSVGTVASGSAFSPYFDTGAAPNVNADLGLPNYAGQNYAANFADGSLFGAGRTPERLAALTNLPGFDRAGYLAANPDVAQNGLDPLEHFLTYGIGEGRQGSGVDPAVAATYAMRGQGTGQFGYASPYLGGGEGGGFSGLGNGFTAPPGFTASTYLALNPDVAQSGMSPYEHWATYGQRENRQGSGLADPPGFDRASYLAANPDVVGAHLDPVEHFLTYGIREGRQGSGLNSSDFGQFGLNGATSAAYPVSDTGFSAMNPSAGMGAGSFNDVQPFASTSDVRTEGLSFADVPGVPQASSEPAFNFGMGLPALAGEANVPGAVPNVSVPDTGTPYVPGAVQFTSVPDVPSPSIPGAVPNVSVPDAGFANVPGSVPYLDAGNAFFGGVPGSVPNVSVPDVLAPYVPGDVPFTTAPEVAVPNRMDFLSPMSPSQFAGGLDASGGMGAQPTDFAGLTPLSVPNATPAGDGPGGFNRSAYLAANSDVATNGIDPLQHFLQYGAQEHRLGSGVADAQSFAQIYGPQYLSPAAAAPISPFGFGEAYNPSGFMGAQPATSMAPAGFNAAAYLAANPDVARNGMGAWDHFQTYGRQENRQGSGLSPSEYGAFSLGGAGGFNAANYLAMNPDVARNGLNPWQHFQTYGARENRQGSGLDPATFGSFFGPQPAAAYNPAVGPFDFTGMNAGSTAEPGYFSDYAPPPSSYSEPAYSPPPAAGPSFDFSGFGGSFGGGGGFLPGTPDPGTYRPGSPGMSPSQAGHASYIAAQQANTRTLEANRASNDAFRASLAGPLTAPMPPLPYNGPPTNIYAVPLFP